MDGVKDSPWIQIEEIKNFFLWIQCVLSYNFIYFSWSFCKEKRNYLSSQTILSLLVFFVLIKLILFSLCNANISTQSQSQSQIPNFTNYFTNAHLKMKWNELVHVNFHMYDDYICTFIACWACHMRLKISKRKSIVDDVQRRWMNAWWVQFWYHSSEHSFIQSFVFNCMCGWWWWWVDGDVDCDFVIVIELQASWCLVILLGCRGRFSS